MEVFLRFLICSILFSFVRRAAALDTISPGQSIKDGETLVSSKGTFEFGFFRPGSSKSLYLGLWYRKPATQTVAWVANREAPLSDGEGFLVLDSKGTLALLNSTKGVLWSSNTSETGENPVAQLLDSGNLVVKDGKNNDSGKYLWQSFDYPSDTLLPGMKLGKNLKTGFVRFLSSWRSTEDPAPGQYSARIDPRGFPQLVFEQGPQIQFRAGPWNGISFEGLRNGLEWIVGYAKLNLLITHEYVLNDEEVYYTYEVGEGSVLTRYVLNPSGLAQVFVWRNGIHDWDVLSLRPLDLCQNYAFCGKFASCNINRSPVCSCLEGFVPKFPVDWNSGDWSGGCVRDTALDCDKDGFLKHTKLKWPDTSNATVNITMNLKECKQMCLTNCSCTAYTNADIRNGGSGCLLWFGDLIDIRDLTPGGDDLYIRLAPAEIAHLEQTKRSSERKQVAVIASSVIIGIGILILGIVIFIRKEKHRKERLRKKDSRKDYMNDGEEELMLLPMFDFETIVSATNNFSSNNKLGQGGFGTVYKGTLLEEGQDIAVKRLSRSSGQGLQEFKNEVVLIAKLQHRNLVKLLGCCIEGDERMLIYEYMPNKSLDYFIFNKERSKLLDWHKRANIINGIARGLLYLHLDSRLRIIHRDLKAANILLDSEMNPKISDFGVARTFLGEQNVANTNKVVGTYGYMPPEYAVRGLFSVKSDVFSFGVLVLEIITGKSNRGFLHPDHHHTLLGHAWILWIERNPLGLIDENVLTDFTMPSEVLRYIHVGLLCVQHRPEDRPDMLSVVLMLRGESALPEPKQPGFFTGQNLPVVESSESRGGLSSTNELFITELDVR
ncbi:hypothetical protein SLA2020_120520 [Shorea laevis]